MSDLVLDGTVSLGAASLELRCRIKPGQHLVVIGPNGAGKSTLLRTLAGLTPLSTGRLTLADRVLDDPQDDVFVPAHDRPIALQPQAGALFPHLSVLDNVAFPLRSTGCSRADARAQARAHLDAVDASMLADRSPGELSGGQAARVALARSLAAEPEILLLDEPAAALDVVARASLRHIVDGIDQAVVTVTHDPVEARLLGEHFLVLDNGATVQSGSIDEVSAAPATAWVAGLLGLNIVTGTAHGNLVSVPGGRELHLAERAQGPVHITFPSNAVALHRSRPSGSARNVFAVAITDLTAEGDRVRVGFDAGFSATAVVTAGAAAELQLRPGGEAWVSIKATELTALPA